MGVDPKYPDFYPAALLKILEESGIDFSWEQDVRVAIWSKYMFIAAYGLVTATYDKCLGQILENPELSRITKSIMYEVEIIAGKLNIPLSHDIVDASFHKANQFPYETKTSFQRDVESKGKLNEADLFGGTIIRLGKEVAIPVPATMKIMSELMKRYK